MPFSLLALIIFLIVYAIIAYGVYSSRKMQYDERQKYMQSISIAALTDYLFGKKEESVDNCETLTEEGKMLLKNICPLSENCIMEIV